MGRTGQGKARGGRPPRDTRVNKDSRPLQCMPTLPITLPFPFPLLPLAALPLPDSRQERRLKRAKARPFERAKRAGFKGERGRLSSPAIHAASCPFSVPQSVPIPCSFFLPRRDQKRETTLSLSNSQWNLSRKERRPSFEGKRGASKRLGRRRRTRSASVSGLNGTVREKKEEEVRGDRLSLEENEKETPSPFVAVHIRKHLRETSIRHNLEIFRRRRKREEEEARTYTCRGG